MDTHQLAEHLRFYQELGVTGISRDPAWRLRARRSEPNEPVEGTEPSEPGDPLESAELPAPSGAAAVMFIRSPAEALTAIRTDLGDCCRCKLHAQGRKQLVFGAGSPTAELMFVGEAPGADEDEQGVPFVGRAGQLLTKMIEAMGFRRDEVYIANVLKCRPPGNRDPHPDEVESCEPFLFRQIDTIQPKVIVALGKFAAHTLLRTQDPISRLRGRVYEYRGRKLIPTFHPSFLLRSPGYKREAWEDLKKALAVMGRQPPGAAQVDASE